MSLPARHRRSLDRIEKRLAVDDPHLESMFAIFARLTRHEGMPVTERAGIRPRWLQPAFVILLAVLMVLLFSLLLPAGTWCGRTALASSRRQLPSSLTTRCPPDPANVRESMR